MMRPYLFCFNATMGSRQQVVDFLDTLPQILNWYAPLPQSIILISDQPARTLRELIHNRYPQSFFIITEIQSKGADGWLPKAAWDFINRPRSSGRWG